MCSFPGDCPGVTPHFALETRQSLLCFSSPPDSQPWTAHRSCGGGTLLSFEDVVGSLPVQQNKLTVPFTSPPPRLWGCCSSTAQHRRFSELIGHRQVVSLPLVQVPPQAGCEGCARVRRACRRGGFREHRVKQTSKA